MRNRGHVVAGLAGIVTLALALAAVATAGSRAESGQLGLRGDIRLSSNLGGCPPPSDGVDCAARTSSGLVPGLGEVSATYEFHVAIGRPTCQAPEYALALAYPIRLVVRGKGEIYVAVAQGSACILEAHNQAQTFTITGGAGLYAGASGNGVLERQLGSTTNTGRHGRETWNGTLSVPGLEFDTTPPELSGASNKTVKARKGVKSFRVKFAVTARDDKDGAVPVTCAPKSGFRFRVGKTSVTCSATDSSGNTATARFTVTVTRRR